MLSEIFYWVLNMSIIGAVTGLVVLMLRKIKKLPRFAVYLLWILPLIRLWVPFGIVNRYSLINLISKFTTKTVVIWEITPEFSMTNSIMAANRYFPIEYKTNLLENVFSVASMIWVILAAAAIMASVLLYYFTKSDLRTAVPLRDNIYKSDKIITPAVYGIICPKIIIPAAIANGNIDYIVMHERVHIKRRDNLLRIVAVITACVHWFNPFVWIYLKYFFADMELACDVKVVKTLDVQQKKEYASVILSSAAGKAFFASAFGGVKTKIRIENILTYKKMTVLSTLCFAILIAAIAVVLITNATL